MAISWYFWNGARGNRLTKETKARSHWPIAGLAIAVVASGLEGALGGAGGGQLLATLPLRLRAGSLGRANDLTALDSAPRPNGASLIAFSDVRERAKAVSWLRPSPKYYSIYIE